MKMWRWWWRENNRLGKRCILANGHYTSQSLMTTIFKTSAHTLDRFLREDMRFFSVGTSETVHYLRVSILTGCL